jgi:O-antigen/teichoic acid export membrane protein
VAAVPEPAGPPAARSYASGARILSIGIAATGVLTFAFFSIASHVLPGVEAKRIDLLWSVMFVIISVIYRPIEQLLSRTIADRRARGLERQAMRVPMTIQAAFAVVFLGVALPLHDTVVDGVFDGSADLYWVLVVGTLAYAASYFARGWLAGHQWFGLYGGLVLMEAATRVAFALAVAVGLAGGETAVALGIAAAPFVSLFVVPAAFARNRSKEARPDPPAPSASTLSLRGGTGFALAVSGIQLAEQTLLNVAVLTVAATSSDPLLAGIVFNVLLITRAPLQLFQAIQTSLLPHLAGLEAGAEGAGQAAFARTIRVTLVAISCFSGAVAAGMLVAGPFAMSHLFGQHFAYPRFGLALIALGMGLHLASGALNQAALARGQARGAAAAWLGAAIVFVGWMLAPVIGDQLLRTEVGYSGAAGLLALALWALYRRGAGAPSPIAAAIPA